MFNKKRILELESKINSLESICNYLENKINSQNKYILQREHYKYPIWGKPTIDKQEISKSIQQVLDDILKHIGLEYKITPATDTKVNLEPTDYGCQA